MTGAPFISQGGTEDYMRRSGASRGVARPAPGWHHTGMRQALAPYALPVRRAALFAALCLASAIAYFSLVSPGATPAPQMSDKIRHFAAYAALAMPLAVWFGPGRVAAVVAAAIFGAGLEVAQALGQNGREGSIADALANTAGAVAGAGCVWIQARSRRG